MNKRIWLSLAHMGGREQDFIKEAFDTNWVVPLGPNVDAFEQSLVEYLHEDRRVVALSAGTAALHLGLILLDVKPGDEVICQSFTFAASANPISYLEAKPVFVDSEKDTWNMDPVLLEEAIKDRLRRRVSSRGYYSCPPLRYACQDGRDHGYCGSLWYPRIGGCRGGFGFGTERTEVWHIR